MVCDNCSIIDINYSSHYKTTYGNIKLFVVKTCRHNLKYMFTMEKNSHRILELYSGIGGMHYAFKETKMEGEIVCAIDINTVANIVYKNNFPETNLINRNIQSLSPKFLNDLKPNIILMSPPCQPFTRNGLQKDLDDPRTDSFDHLLDILSNISSVEYILLENVKGFDDSKTRQSFIKVLENCNFYYKEYLLSPHQFGIPNSRLRYYCLARKKPFILLSNKNEIIYEFPETGDPKCFQIRNILDDSVDTTSYNLPAKFLKRAFVLDICHDESERSCCFTKAYTHFLEGTGSVYTKNSCEDIEKTFKTCKNLDNSSDEYMNNIEKLNIRFFTPKEVSRLMSFPEVFRFPENITRKQQYRLLGNSINVKVVSKLISYLISSK